jgi:hypothetical protein
MGGSPQVGAKVMVGVWGAPEKGMAGQWITELGVQLCLVTYKANNLQRLCILLSKGHCNSCSLVNHGDQDLMGQCVERAAWTVRLACVHMESSCR